ncbi:MAG: alpha/beta hydrolase [Chromatiales bacterium]|jgi:hypothetical protein|nr:alpha/beta hydrolase [Chromatiales bacterium]
MPKDLQYDPLKPLFVSPDQRFEMTQAAQALKLAYGRSSAVLIYIHGRAQGKGEPRKSVEKNIYAELESYGCAVIGFTWDASDGGYKVKRPAAAAPQFAAFVEAMATFLEAPENADKRRPSLLTHSMGALVISTLAAGRHFGGLDEKVFNNLVLSAPAVAATNHNKWLKNIQVARRVYVMVNRHDSMLGVSGVFHGRMLGWRLRAPGVESPAVKYVDVGALGVNHRYFVPSRQRKRKTLRRFFRRALTGKRVDFDEIAKQTSQDDIDVQTLLQK